MPSSWNCRKCAYVEEDENGEQINAQLFLEDEEPTVRLAAGTRRDEDHDRRDEDHDRRDSYSEDRKERPKKKKKKTKKTKKTKKGKDVNLEAEYEEVKGFPVHKHGVVRVISGIHGIADDGEGYHAVVDQHSLRVYKNCVRVSVRFMRHLIEAHLDQEDDLRFTVILDIEPARDFTFEVETAEEAEDWVDQINIARGGHSEDEL